MYRLLDDPHPPRATPDHLTRIRNRAVRIRRRKAALGAAAAATVIAGGFTAVLAASTGPRSAQVQVTPAASATPTAPVPAATPTGQAYQLLDAVIVPPGAQRVSSLPGPAFAEAWETLGCTPVIDVSRLWVVSENAVAAFSYIDSHPPTWITYNVSGENTDNGALTASIGAGNPTGPGWSRPDYPSNIVFATAPTADGQTGIRVDAEVVPPGASCETSTPAFPTESSANQPSPPPT